MEQTIERFIVSLRRAGVRISLSESIDALRSADLVGCSDREILKHALSASLAKSLVEKEILERTFDRFFSFDSLDVETTEPVKAGAEDPSDTYSSLTRMLLAGDSAGLAVSIMEAARASDLPSIRFFTQRGLYTQRILDQMGLGELSRDMESIAREGAPGSGQKLGMLHESREEMVRRVKRLVDRELALTSGSSTGEPFDEEYLASVKLSELEDRDLQRIHRLVLKMVKALNGLYSRRRIASRRGQLDFKRTLRRNLAFQGVPFDRKWKAKKMDRPDVVVICDVSRSVSAVVRFLLLFLYSLSEALMRIRTFIFCSNIVEVTHIFEECSVEQALAKIQTGAGTGVWMGLTDYGEALLGFKEKWLEAITRKTTVIMLGDARNNHGNPQTAILETIYRRCGRLIWLNPEHRSLWTSGDSEMKHYLPYCHMARECYTFKHLEKVVHSLLRSSLG